VIQYAAPSGAVTLGPRVPVPASHNPDNRHRCPDPGTPGHLGAASDGCQLAKISKIFFLARKAL
jgi:hypothetical protein